MWRPFGTASEKLFAWVGPRGLVNFPQMQVLAVYPDDPESTDPAELRSDACITVPEGTDGDETVNVMRSRGGGFAVAHVEIDPSEYGAAWSKLFTGWMPAHGHQPDTEAGACAMNLTATTLNNTPRASTLSTSASRLSRQEDLDRSLAPNRDRASYDRIRSGLILLSR